MSDRKSTSDEHADTPPLNREERRAREFDHQANRNPAMHQDGDSSESYAGRPDQDVVRTTGAGTGGATESDGRVKHHEGQHLGNQPNS
jgi:hypothetical protein